MVNKIDSEDLNNINVNDEKQVLIDDNEVFDQFLDELAWAD